MSEATPDVPVTPPDDSTQPVVVDTIRLVAIIAAVASLLAGVSSWFGDQPSSALLDAGPIPPVVLAALVVAAALTLLGRSPVGRSHGLALGAAIAGAVFFSTLTASAAAEVASPTTAGFGFVAVLVATGAWWILVGALFALARRTTRSTPVGTPGLFAGWWLAAGAVIVVVGSILPPSSTTSSLTDWVFVDGDRSFLVNLSTVLWLLALLVAIIPILRRDGAIFLTAVAASSLGVVVALARSIELNRPAATVGAPMVSLDIHGIAVVGVAAWAIGAAIGVRRLAVGDRPVLAGEPWRRVLIVCTVLGLVGGVLASFAAGVMVGEREQPEVAAAPAPVVVEVPSLDVARIEAAAPPEINMPNLIGLPEDVARTVIADLGTSTEVPVVVDQVGSAGEPGYVLGQSPPPGSDEPVAVTLTIGVPVAMPALTGMAESDAVLALEAVGARVTVERRYEPTAAPGTVLEVDPADGNVPDEVTLTVASPPSSTYLDLLDVTRSRCSVVREADLVATQNAERGIACDPRPTAVASIEYVLSRKARTLRFGVGYNDASDQNSRAQVVVLLDGQVAATIDLTYGVLESVEIDVSQAAQLIIEVRDTTPEDVEIDRTSTVVLVDAIVTGSADDLSQLENA